MVDQVDYRNKYKYYKKEMLQTLLDSDKKFNEFELAAITSLIEEKQTKIVSEVILDGGIKDKILIATRWNVFLMVASYIEPFLFKRYDLHWIDGLANFALSSGIGLIGSSLIFIFFTKFAKERFFKLHLFVTSVAILLLTLGSWHNCRVGFC
jgi:hypothetical protein